MRRSVRCPVRRAKWAIRSGLFDIEQLVAPGQVAAQPLLPSQRYHPAPGELAPGDVRLPWSDDAGGADAGTAPGAGDNGLAQPAPVIGALARRLGAQVPGRLVTSAKSWLSHAAVDRLAPILPWGAPAEVPKVSPVAACASYLAHVRAAWNARHPEAPLEAQDLVLTLPASFDDVARALTLQAAADAGLPTVRLLEEPQAAFYDWLHRHRDTLATELAPSHRVLVCDVGGGTTDLSLVDVSLPGDGAAPVLTRVGVGNHLMLGGDNMDLALAHLAETRLGGGAVTAAGGGLGTAAATGGAAPAGTAGPAATGGAAPAGTVAPARLTSAALAQLTERCRAAKETLLAAGAPDRATVTLLASGSRLVGGARSVELTRDEVERVVVDGFFPSVPLDAAVQRARSGLVAWGLPYAADAAVTRHLAAFLRTQGGALPDTLLLNGGVFRAAALARRLRDTLADWRGAPLRLLHNADPDVAVARGAVAYALSLAGGRPRIGGGSARSYFLLLDEVAPARGAGAQTGAATVAATGASDGAVAGAVAGATTAVASGPSPGAASTAPLPPTPTPTPTRRAVCVLPRGTEPGPEIRLADRSFALRLGQPVRFHLVSATADPGGRPPQAGDLVTLDGDGSSDGFVPLPPVATVVRAHGGRRSPGPNAAAPGSATGERARGPANAAQEVRVQLATTLTEVGTLQMHCVAADDPSRRWLLEFQLRGHEAGADDGEAPSGASAATPAAVPAATWAEAVEAIERVFGARGLTKTPGHPKASFPPRGAGRAQPGPGGSEKVDPKEVKQLRARLERLLGSRERWPAPLLRALYDALWQRARGRRRSAEHERLWLNLAGYCLRPGFGDPLDAWRIEQLWPAFEAGVQHAADAQVASEWWTLWRRVAGGLPEDAQLRLLDDFAQNLEASERGGKRPASVVRGGVDDMLRLGAALERVPASHKAEIGDWLLDRLAGPPSPHDALTLWALGRLGARQPFHGSAHGVVPPETVQPWLERVLALDWKRHEGAAFAAAHLARLTGDRARDLPAELRAAVIARLTAAHAAPSWIAMVREVVALDDASARQVFGESLPPGLRLVD